MNKFLLSQIPKSKSNSTLKDSHEISRVLERVTNTTSKEYLDSNIEILPNKDVSLGNFKKSRIQSHIYYAHPSTIKALKKNIFYTDKEFDDLEEIIICESCKKELDKQFWYFCPYCERKFPS
jgi:hypothetical protein